MAANPGKMPVVIPGAALQALNSLQLPARAAWFSRVDSVESLQALLGWWQRQQFEQARSLPLMALGGGSNLVLAEDFPGLVVQVSIAGRELVAEDDDHVWLRVGAGESWPELVRHCVDFHYWGLENLALIPGSVGAAPIQNIGAYGVELSDCFVELTALELNSGLSVTFDRDACGFGYRDSVFKQQLRDRYLITSVTLRLDKHRNSDRVEWNYPVLQRYFAERGIDAPGPWQVFEAVSAIRRSKLPDPQDIPNAGSFFKNPLVSASHYRELLQAHPQLIGYEQADGQVKLAAGWLIDQAGWRGYRRGPIGVHRDQALVLINPGQGDGRALLTLAADIQADIHARFGVSLEIEPRVYGALNGVHN